MQRAGAAPPPRSPPPQCESEGRIAGIEREKSRPHARRLFLPRTKNQIFWATNYQKNQWFLATNLTVKFVAKNHRVCAWSPPDIATNFKVRGTMAE